MCDMDPILTLAAKHDLVVIEDCCQAVFSTYKGRLAGTIGHAGAFSFDSEKTMGSDTGGCIVTNDDDLAERMRFYGQSRGAKMQPHFGRLHVVPGYAFRMPLCTAAITLGQLEIARENVAHRDKMIRLQTDHMARVPGIIPLPIPDYQEVYSCWMVGISLAQGAFKCGAEEFGDQLAAEGLTGAGISYYYLMPEALTFLNENARAGKYPYSKPPASRDYRYDDTTCPTAHAFLQGFIRWSTFCEKYEPEHCELAAEIVRVVADRNRR
jgi:dTDP-4-amino-4,6-dideoxygalactose transaminase